MERSPSSADQSERPCRAIPKERPRAAGQAARLVVETYLQYCCERQTAPRVSELADRLQVHRLELTRWFKRVTGLQLAVYMRQRQVRLAEDLLMLNPNLTIEEVASRAGFGTVRSMYRVFRRDKGISPGAVRSGALSLTGRRMSRHS